MCGISKITGLPENAVTDTIAVMSNDIPPELERYLALCKRVYERMQRDGSWPWKDSPDSQAAEDLLELEDDQHNHRSI